VTFDVANQEAFREWLFCQSLRQAQILILQIHQYIPVVKIIVFLDLEKNISFSDSLLVNVVAGGLALREKWYYYL